MSNEHDLAELDEALVQIRTGIRKHKRRADPEDHASADQSAHSERDAPTRAGKKAD
jgi:hypothetical protein